MSGVGKDIQVPSELCYCIVHLYFQSPELNK